MNWDWIHDTLNMMAVALADHENKYTSDPAHADIQTRRHIAHALVHIREAKAEMVKACCRVEEIRSRP